MDRSSSQNDFANNTAPVFLFDECAFLLPSLNRVLLVEDDPATRRLYEKQLCACGFEITACSTGEEAFDLYRRHNFALVVLDWFLPGMDGLSLCRKIRGEPGGDYTVVIVITGCDQPEHLVQVLDAGADDYLTKPFALQELVLRLRALDRRRAHSRPPVREIAGLRLDPFRREVHRDGRYVALTRKQFAVLEVLVTADGGVVSAEELLQRAWDEHADPFTNAVRITVSALRKRLGEPWVIATVPGVGYRIDAGGAA